jgi:hypothetical protein
MSGGLRLVQFVDDQGVRRVAVVEGRDHLLLVDRFSSVYELAQASIRSGQALATLAEASLSGKRLDYEDVVTERRLLPPLDHPDPARCMVSLTGLTHVGSAQSRDKMHAAAADGASETDSIRMFRLGVAGGKPKHGEIGVQPEWAYKGDGRCVVAPEQPITQPAFADDGGEEAEIAGLYVIDDLGDPWRVGFVIGNEFSDHVMEKKNYLYLAHSKLRQCSFGPELALGPLPDAVSGTTRILRDGQTVWSAEFQSGEASMCHSIANLEFHHFKHSLFRRPGDVHVHFFGASAISFSSAFRTRSGDVFEIDVPAFGRPLRNALQVETKLEAVPARAL